MVITHIQSVTMQQKARVTPAPPTLDMLSTYLTIVTGNKKITKLFTNDILILTSVQAHDKF